MVRFIWRFVESLELGRPAIVGNSVGGSLALMMALHDPGRLSGLVLVDSASLGREVSLYLRLASVPWLGDLLESSRLGGTRFMLYRVFHDSSFVTQELVDELYRSRQAPGAKEAVVSVLRNTVSLRGVRREYVLADELARVQVPLMVVWGAQDRILPVSHAHRASESAPHARVEIFDECGHWPHMEKASRFNELVLEFLSSR